MSALRRTSIILLLWGGTLHAQKTLDQRLEQNSPGKLHATTLSDTARLEWVRHLSSNTASSIDLATDVKMDANGCVYVTGKTEGQDNGRDYLTVKYNTLGQELWRARYDGPAHADDVPSALAIDASGNVYVTGMSIGIDPYYSVQYDTYDYATIKYNSAGQQEWVARYKNVPRGTDAATAIAVDTEGNVYVTGESDHADSTISQWYLKTDFATIKYSSDGAQEWVARYDCLEYAADRAAALSLDDSGNVYVVGGGNIHGTVTGWYSKVVAVKYAPDGVQQWVATIGTDTTSMEAVAISIDHLGSVYIVGHAGTMNWSRQHPRIFTAAYDTQGERQWLRFFDESLNTPFRAKSLAIDGSRNVVVAGVGGPEVWFRDQGIVALTLKYNPLGDLLWAREYQEPGSPSPVIRVAGHGVDDVGNIYVAASTGRGANAPDPLDARTILALKYDANGGMQWVQRYSGVENSNNLAAAIAVDRSGHIAVAGGSGLKNRSDFVAIKYEPLGRKEWDARVTGEGSSFESFSAMVVDNAGNVYLTGSSVNANTSSDYVTAKFNSEGDQMWSARYDSPEKGTDYPLLIALDPSGSVYVTGYSSGSQGFLPSTTLKYDADGSQRWAVRYGIGFTPLCMQVDRSGNSYVGGFPGLVKYDNQGNQLWSTTDIVSAMTLDRQGALYFSTSTGIIKVDSMGVRQALIDSSATDIAVDDSGSVYLTLYDGGQFTKKYSPSGSLLWSYSFGGTQIRLDRFGNAIVKRPYGSMLAFKLTPAGALAWCVDFQSAFWGPTDFALDEFGGLYLAGPKEISPPLASIPAFSVVKYNSLGLRQWSAQYNSPENLAGTPSAIGVDGSGNVYVAGITERGDFSTDITLVKYSQVTVSVKEDDSELPNSYSLSQNYPNPFNPSTTIQFALPKSGHVELKVYNTLGQEVATLVNEEKVAGTYSTQWNANNGASGVYFYRLQSGEFTQTRKLLLLK